MQETTTLTRQSSLKNLKNELLLGATNFRHGIALKPQTAKTGMSDISGIWHVGVPQNSAEPWKSAAGGVGRNLISAQLSAVGEALERYSAFTCKLPVKLRTQVEPSKVIGPEDFSLFSDEQIGQTDFPFKNLYAKDVALTKVFSLYDSRETWVPHGLVSLKDDFNTGLSTSSGTAAGPSRYFALLRAVQELIERDALMVSWLHSIPGQQVDLGGEYLGEVEAKGGKLTCIDATPAYSSHPVAIVSGSLPIRGFNRFSLGSACRETWEEAVEKAFLEWAQGVFFAGYYYSLHPNLEFKDYDDVNTFDAHAVYYTVNPNEWDKIPLLQGEPHKVPYTLQKSGSNQEALTRLVKHLKQENVRMYYRDLTTPDLLQLGIYTVRAVSPDLAPIFCHQKYPFLGGRVADVSWRYPWVNKYKLRFPNPMPHPLG
ncbi:MAG: hypothetical protein NVS1B7_6370 [Candidatus Saccharimonadales bacterium]